MARSVQYADALVFETGDVGTAPDAGLANQLIVSANYPSGQPGNFELIAADGTHTQFSNISGLTEELKRAGYATGLFGKLHFTPMGYTTRTLGHDYETNDATPFLAPAGRRSLTFSSA